MVEVRFFNHGFDNCYLKRFRYLANAKGGNHCYSGIVLRKCVGRGKQVDDFEDGIHEIIHEFMNGWLKASWNCRTALITQTEVFVDQLDPIFYTDFQKKSLELSVVPSYFKRSTIIPDPKTAYRPIALTSVVIKCFRRLVLAYLKDTGSLLDLFQFAYRSNLWKMQSIWCCTTSWSTLDSPRTYAQILFMEFTSAFNMIILDIPHCKLSQLSVPTYICNWITSFLINRE